MKNHKLQEALKAIAIMTIVFIAGLLAGFYLAPPQLKETIFNVHNISALLPEAGYKTANISMDGTKVYLTAGCQALAFDVTEDQAFSIRLGLDKDTFSRPMTHDLLKDIFDHYEFQVRAAAIDRFEDEIYKARITISRDDQVLDIDSRPSDAIALAARYGLGMKIKETILAEKGIAVC